MTSPIPSEPRTGPEAYHAPPFSPAQAWKLLAVGIGIIYGVQVVGAVVGTIGVVASVASDLVCIGFFVTYAQRHRIGLRGLGIQPVGLRWIVAAILLGSMAWYPNSVLISLLPLPDNSKILKDLISESSLLPMLAAIALLPAVAEEIVFRGILARTLGIAHRPAFAIVVSSALFGIYHVIPIQVVGTFLLGCLLGLLTLRSRSIVPSMIAHLLNNAAAIIVSRQSIPGLTSWIETHPFGMLGLSVPLVLAGIVLCFTERQ